MKPEKQEPMSEMVAAQERRPAREQMATYIIEALPATLIAACILFAIYHSTLAPTVT